LAGATQATLTLTNVRATDAAAYSVAITNAFGTAVSASARLTVNPAPTPPQIETPPTDRTVTEGATVSLGVTASGAGVLSYRWLKGGVPIVGATSATLTFSPVRLTDAGSYAVEVSNAAGTAVSTAAVVRVEPRPSSRITNVSIRTPLAVGRP
jgi:hypothetical protein